MRRSRNLNHTNRYLPTGNMGGRLGARRGQGGFVLVATIFAIAIMAIGAAYFAGRVDELRTQAMTLSLWADGEVEAFSTREALIHKTLTSSDNRPGAPSLKSLMALDGRPYKLSESLEITVQDEGGLISIATVDEALLSRFLESIGIPIEQRNRYLDVLNDYIDADDLRRLNGAEKNEYAAVNLTPPPNDFPSSRDELRRMLAWKDLIAIVEERLGPAAAERFVALFTASRTPGINMNSAPVPVLAVVAGVKPGRAQALADQRRISAFTSLAEFAPYTDGPLNFESAWVIPSASWRVSHRKIDLPFLLECRVVFTPFARDRPAQVSECQRRPVSSIDATWDKQFASVADPTLRQVSLLNSSSANLSRRTTERTIQPFARNETAPHENQRNANIQPLDWLSRYLDDAERSTERANRLTGSGR